MNAKTSRQLLDLLREAAETEPDREMPVIVTIAKGADLETLRARGLRIQRVFESIPAVSGTLPASSVAALADLEEVESIDYDGEVHAL